MTVSRDVVLDLLPLYLSGEASADSRALVDACLAADPALARLVRSGGWPGDAMPVPPHADDAAGRAALARTRRLLQRRQTAFAAALFLTLLPWSFGFAGDHVVWAMWRDAPRVAAACTAAAAVSWWWFARVRAALRAPGF